MNSRNLVGMLEGKKKLSKLKNTISYQYCVEQAKKLSMHMSARLIPQAEKT